MEYLFPLWITQFLVMLFFVGGVIGLLVGLGLIFRSEATLRFFDYVNHWISLRRATKPFEIPRDTQPTVQKYRRILAVLFIVGAAFSIFVLITKFDARSLMVVFNPQTVSSPVALWAVDTLRWLLIAGNVIAIVIGIMLGFFPQALTTLESRGSRWYSHRQATKPAEQPNMVLDRWVASSPRAAGWAITIASLILVVQFGILVFRF